MSIRTLLLVTIAALTMSACSSPVAAGISVKDPWVRPVSAMGEPTPAADASGEGMGEMEMAGGPVSAAYMTITNGGAADRLLKAEGDVAASIELHTMIEENGVMQMRPVEGGIEVPANGDLVLKPGGYHIMLIGVQRDLKMGDKVSLTLQFEKAGTVKVEAQVRMP